MKIKKLREVFKKMLKDYETVLKNETVSIKYLRSLDLQYGLCCLSEFKYNVDIFKTIRYHYKNYFTHGRFIATHPTAIYHDNFEIINFHTETMIFHECLKFRKNFLKNEIKYLKSLLDKGYTDI